MAIEITDGLAHLTIEVLARSYADGEYWDSNWVVTPITVTLPGFQAAFTEGMHLSELHGFYQDLKRLYSELKGVACFDVREGFLGLNAEMGSLVDQPGRTDRYGFFCPRRRMLALPKTRISYPGEDNLTILPG